MTYGNEPTALVLIRDEHGDVISFRADRVVIEGAHADPWAHVIVEIEGARDFE